MRWSRSVLRWHPQLGNFLAYVVAMATGYLMHSRWSFRDHGGERTHGTKVRFVIVSLISYALNSFWVWLLDRRRSSSDRGVADRADAVRHAGGDLRCSTASGFSADGARRLRADGRARPAPLVVPRAARGHRRADPPRSSGRRRTRAMLEIGCGTGHNLAMLGEFGEVDALELDEEARALAEKRLGRPVMSSPLPELAGVPERHYDLVGAFDVIEHIDDDRAALASIAARLKPGGKLVDDRPRAPMDVVGARRRQPPQAPLFEARAQAADRRFAAAAGAIGYFNSLLFPVAVAERMLSKLARQGRRRPHAAARAAQQRARDGLRGRASLDRARALAAGLVAVRGRLGDIAEPAPAADRRRRSPGRCTAAAASTSL